MITRNSFGQLPTTSIWLTAQLPVNFSPKLQWHNDLTYKTMEVSSRAYQRYYRTGLRYQFSKKWNAVNGIGFFTTNVSTDKTHDEYGKEFRIWQEVNYQYSAKKNLGIQHRFRTEERFYKETDTKSAFHILNLTYRLSFTKPIAEKWDLLWGDEYFEQAYRGKFIFNQNRVITAAVYTVNKTTQFQGGYIWVLRKTLSQHVIQLTYRKSILLYGKKNQKQKPTIPNLPETE
ncbi:MAG: DUF2490 domain-containing protein [Bacteroidota bacterium]